MIRRHTAPLFAIAALALVCAAMDERPGEVAHGAIVVTADGLF